MTPLVLIPGRLSPEAKGVREAAIASGRRYSEAIARSGGVALTVPPLESTLSHIDSLVERADAMLLHGGRDLDPALYGQTQSSDGQANSGHLSRYSGTQRGPWRHVASVFCRQITDSDSHWDTYHPVEVNAGSGVVEAIGTLRPAGGHSYHQSIDRVASDVQVVAHRIDGVIEAVDHRTSDPSKN